MNFDFNMMKPVLNNPFPGTVTNFIVELDKKNDTPTVVFHIFGTLNEDIINPETGEVVCLPSNEIEVVYHDDHFTFRDHNFAYGCNMKECIVDTLIKMSKIRNVEEMMWMILKYAVEKRLPTWLLMHHGRINDEHTEIRFRTGENTRWSIEWSAEGCTMSNIQNRVWIEVEDTTATDIYDSIFNSID